MKYITDTNKYYNEKIKNPSATLFVKWNEMDFLKT
jgi:hypothetical protein